MVDNDKIMIVDMNEKIDFTVLAFEKIKNYEENVIKQIFPNAELSQSSLFCKADVPINSFTAHLSSKNLFIGTPYENDGTGNFLHFTSLPVLSQILNSGFLRMSDFNCLSDKTEIDFAKNFYFENEPPCFSKTNKSKIFCLSACESSNETILNHHMWQAYADKGKGCAIEYKFTSNDIFNMSFGKIQYGVKKMNVLKTLRENIKQFSMTNDGFSMSNISDFLIPIFAFHKANKFQNENEIRLFYFQNGAMSNNKNHLNQYSGFYKSNQVRNFVKIYLKGKNPISQENYINEVNVLKYSPQIEISKITLGNNIFNLLEVVEQLEDIKKQLNLEFEIWKVSENEHFKLNRISSSGA